MRLRRLAAPVLGAALALGTASAASAHVKYASTTPAIHYFASALPVVGTTLSNPTEMPSVTLKDGWKMSSPHGIASAYVQFCGSCKTIWTYSGGADSVTGRYQWNQQANTTSVLYGSATDQLGNTGRNNAYIFPDLQDSSFASYSSGWQTSDCKCYTNGHILYSTKPGATATFQSEGAVASFVSDTGPTRGEVALSVNGSPFKDVNLSVGSATVNRVIVWDSPYITTGDGAYTLTVKVVSGRVDVEGFITE